MARGSDDDGVDVELEEFVDIRRSVTRAGEGGLHERGDVGWWFAAVASQQLPNLQARQGGFYSRRGEGREEAYGVAQQLWQGAAGAEHQDLAELRVDGHADQNFGDAIGDHFLHEEGVGQAREAVGGGFGLSTRPDVEGYAAYVGFVLQRGAGGLHDDGEADCFGGG